MTTSYNGHKNWNHWNVSLWINNDAGLYELAKRSIAATSTRVTASRKRAAEYMLDSLREYGQEKTPDGAPYSVSSIRAAMVGM